MYECQQQSNPSPNLIQSMKLHHLSNRLSDSFRLLKVKTESLDVHLVVFAGDSQKPPRPYTSGDHINELMVIQSGCRKKKTHLKKTVEGSNASHSSLVMGDSLRQCR